MNSEQQAAFRHTNNLALSLRHGETIIADPYNCRLYLMIEGHKYEFLDALRELHEIRKLEAIEDPAAVAS